MDPNPYRPPPSIVEVPDASLQALQDAQRLLMIATSHQLMMWLFLVKGAAEFTVGIFAQALQAPALWFYWLAFATLQLTVSYFIFRVVQELYGLPPAIVGAVVAIAPCFGSLTVLLLNGNVMDYARKRGMKLGFMGATRTQLDELRYKVASMQEQHPAS